MDKDVLECILKRNWKMGSLDKVLSVERAPAVGKFVNYLSTVERLSLKVALGNGKVVNKSLVVKSGTGGDEFLSEFNGKYDTFKTETMMYNTLAQIEYLMEEVGDTEDILWCKMVHHVPYSLIVMEDLRAFGFHMIGREEFYDLDHTLLSVHSLGRYHAMFKSLEERGMSPTGLKPWYLFDSEKMHHYMYCDLIGLLEGVKKFWDPSWKPIVEKIKITKTEVHERLENFMELDENKFNVTNHGDCHKNNIVIKYNWDKRPIAVRFLDFQLSHYGSPCIDLTYMLYLAVDPTVRRDNFELILRTYHTSLINTLDKYQYKGNRPDFEEIKDGMEKHSFMGLMLSLSWHPNLLQSEKMDQLRDFEKILKTDGMEGYADGNFKPDVLEKSLGPDIKDFVKRFCSNC